MERNSVDRKTKIILPATIHEEYKDGMWIAEVAMVDKEEFSKVPKELVLCKDCKHKEKDGISEGFHYCNVNGLQVTDDWFCADGKRE